MLDFLRRKAQSPYIQATIVIIIVVFIFWLPKMGDDSTPNVVATVNGEKIGYREFQKVYEQTVSQYRDQLGGAIPAELLESLGLKQQMIRRLIEERLVLQGGTAAGLRASNQEVQAIIQQMESFKEAGIFKLDRYQQLLASSRLSAKEFEAGIRTDLLKSKITEHLGNYGHISEAELRERFNRVHEEVTVRYTTFAPDDFTKEVTVTEAGLQQFHETHKEQYKTQPRVKAQYVAFLHAGSGTEAAFKEANEAYEATILAGSLEKGAAAKALTLKTTDLFSRETPDPALAAYPDVVNAALGLKPGELSSLLETRDGYFILFVTERQEPVIPPLDEVRAAVTRDFIAAEALKLAEQAAGTMLQEVRDGKDFAIAAGSRTVRQSPSYSQETAMSSGLPQALSTTGLQLTMKAPMPEKTATDGERYYVIQLVERRTAPEELFAGKRQALTEELLREKRVILLDAWVEYLENQGKITTSSQYL